MQDQFRHLPSVQNLLQRTSTFLDRSRLPYPWIRDEARLVLENARKEITAGHPLPEIDILTEQLRVRVASLERQLLGSVINGTGVLIHTNLGRAPIPAELLGRAASVASGYCSLEYDVESGQRGQRAPALERLISTAAGTEASLVVNNNAAAVLLALAALAKDREVIVSRGELVEIGGGFRVPDVIAQSGCRLVEVGTTNKTRLEDYRGAVTADTAVVLKIHPSNFKIQGFTEEPSRAQLRQLADENGILFLEDLGSGAFWSPPTNGADEPLVQETARHSHLVTFSGDKLLGGPQAGILTGRSEVLAQVRRHPLFRALRSDKLNLFLLQELFLYIVAGREFELPLWQMAHASVDTLRERAASWLQTLGPGLEGSLAPSQSTMGGGSLPEETLPTCALFLSSSHMGCEALSKHFRSQEIPLITRIEEDRVVLDPRSVLPEQDGMVQLYLRQGVMPC